MAKFPKNRLISDRFQIDFGSGDGIRTLDLGKVHIGLTGGYAGAIPKSICLESAQATLIISKPAIDLGRSCSLFGQAK